MEYDRNDYGVKMHHRRIAGEILPQTLRSGSRDCLDSGSGGGDLIGSGSVADDIVEARK